MADPEEEHGTPLIWDQIEAQRAVIKFLFETLPPPPYVRVWMTGDPLSEGLDPQLVLYALNKPSALISANP